MGKTEESFVDVWGFDTSKYNADSDAAEEVDVKTEQGVSTIDQEPEAPEDKDKTKPEDGVPGESEETDAGEKQGAEEEKQDTPPAEESKEDASPKPQKEEEPAEQVTEYQELAQGLVNEDLLDFDDEKEYDFDSEEGLKELISETVEKRSAAAISTYKDNLGEEAKQLLEVLEKGGTVDDFQKLNQQIDFKDIPLEDKNGNAYEKNQMYLIEDWMKVQNYDKEEIEETINDYVEGGLLKKQAAIAQKKLAQWQEKENKALLAQKEQEQAEAQRIAEEQATNFKESVIATREISGFKVTEAKAKKLYDFITAKDKDGKSEFDKRDTPENRLLYAYFAMEGFDKEKLSKEIASKQAKSLKRKLSRFSDSNAAPKRSANEVKRTNQELGDIPWSM